MNKFSKYTKKSLSTLFYISNGNKKLKSNDYVKFMIFNLPAVKTCPYATKHCIESCYARKAETVYPDVLPSRERNYEFSKSDDFIHAMIRYIEITLDYEKKHNNRLVWFRIHESGDFYNKEYADKWLYIAKHFENENIVFHAYTKSFRYFDGVNLPKNFALVASVWDDTSDSQHEIIERNNWTVYTACNKGNEPTNATNCRCDDCGTCKECINHKDGNALIYVYIH